MLPQQGTDLRDGPFVLKAYLTFLLTIQLFQSKIAPTPEVACSVLAGVCGHDAAV